MPDARCRYRIIRTGVDATVQHSAIASIGSTITMLESYSGCISETRTSYWKATLIQQKENILFFKADKKYVYLEFLTMGDENAPKEHIPIVRMCKPCVAFMGEYFWSKYLPKEFWEGYEQAVLHTLKRLVDDPSVESDADLIKYAREIVHGDMLIDW